jgi:hypothetical protein
MASYTFVPDSVLEPGDPIRSVDIIAIKDNIEHYAENNGTTTVFTTSGTWTKPATVKRVKVTVVGGGGSGSRSTGSATGGSGGGCAIKWINAASISGNVTVTVGTGGAATSSTANSSQAGSAGNTSSFGSFCSATGGQAGATSISLSNCIGGVGSGGDINLTGGEAKVSGSTAAKSGGDSFFGEGGLSNMETANGTTALSGFGFGSGGGAVGVNTGLINITTTSGAGANGIVIVEEYY